MKREKERIENKTQWITKPIVNGKSILAVLCVRPSPYYTQRWQLTHFHASLHTKQQLSQCALTISIIKNIFNQMVANMPTNIIIAHVFLSHLSLLLLLIVVVVCNSGATLYQSCRLGPDLNNNNFAHFEWSLSGLFISSIFSFAHERCVCVFVCVRQR